MLRLRAEGFSERDIADSVGVARSSIQICLWRAERAGVGWPPPADQDDAALEALLYPRPKPGVEVHPTPDFEWIERELRRKHVTRRQLWREYLARYPDGLKYTAFCVKFQQWRRRGVTMSLTHLPGDRLFVDYGDEHTEGFARLPVSSESSERICAERFLIQRGMVSGTGCTLPPTYTEGEFVEYSVWSRVHLRR